MPTIELPKVTLDVSFVGKDEWRELEEYYFRPIDDPTPAGFEALGDEKGGIESLLRDAFSTYWQCPDDFEVASDFNHAYTLCGGIYSRRPLCREYLEILHGVMQTAPRRELFSYHTVIELTELPPGESLWEFRMHGNRVFVAQEYLRGFDFMAAFTRSRKRRWRL